MQEYAIDTQLLDLLINSGLTRSMVVDVKNGRHREKREESRQNENKTRSAVVVVVVMLEREQN